MIIWIYLSPKSKIYYFEEWNYVYEFENLNMWLIFVVNKSLRLDEYVICCAIALWNKLRWIKVNFEVKMKRFNSKLFYCLLYLIPTVLFSEDAGNSSICYLQEWGVGSMTSKLRSKFLMTSAACRMLFNCTSLASIIFLTWQLVCQRSVQTKG